ncbi:invasion associated locus B family protein [Hyphomicrobium album]|nr:invasion associated locus B family protein [Hyphomicrobium album]
MTRTVRLCVLFLSFVAVLCGSVSSAGAQAPAPAAKAPAAAPAAKEAPPKPAADAAAPQIPWLVNCASLPDQMSCEAIQTLTIQKTGQLLLSISVRIPPNSKTAAMMLHLPHGMFLPDGVSLTIDTNPPQKQPVQTCDQKGCYVGVPIDDTLLKTLQSGKILTIAFKSLEKKEITIPIALSGFKEAYAKLM